MLHDDVIKWNRFPRCRPFVRGIHRSPVNSPHKGQWPELWYYLWCTLEQTIGQPVEMPLIWDAMGLVVTWLQCEVHKTHKHISWFALYIFTFTGSFGWPLNSLFKRLFRLTLKKPSLLALFCRKSIGNWWFLAQGASNGESVSMSCCRHDIFFVEIMAFVIARLVLWTRILIFEVTTASRCCHSNLASMEQKPGDLYIKTFNYHISSRWKLINS